jgi:hypothetical protein
LFVGFFGGKTVNDCIRRSLIQSPYYIEKRD